MTLLGRRRECAALDRLTADVLGGASRTMVLRGDPGAGKSALVQYLVDQLAGWRVLAASGAEAESDLPYSGLHQLCSPLLKEHLNRLPGPQRDALATALGLQAGSPPDRLHVGVATLSLIADAAESQPVACVIDDAQWLDHASLLVLAFVARRLLVERVALVCTVRNGSKGAEDALAGLPELDLQGLNDTDARELLLSHVRGPWDKSVVDQIVLESHGNPLALIELPRTWDPHGPAGGYGMSEPRHTAHKIERSYLRRLALLPPQSQLFALAAAAEPLGDRALLERAAALLGTDLTWADPVVEVGLLEMGDRVTFAHPLARSATYHVANSRDRRSVHRALAAATDSHADPDRRAWHLAHASVGPDEPVALELERSAARAQARGGIAAAAAFLTRSVDLTPDPQVRSRRALEAASAHVQAGTFDAARRLLHIAREGQVVEEQVARSELLGAQLAQASSRGNDAAGLLLAAARRLETLDIDLARETYVDAFVASFFGARLNDSVNGRDVAEAAKAAPHAHRAEPRAADLILDAFTALVDTGYERAVPACRAAISRLETDHDSPQVVLRWYWHGTTLAQELWDDRAAFSFSERHTQVCRAAGAFSQLVLILNAHVSVLVFRGDLSAAESAAAEAQSITEATGIQVAPYGAMYVLAWRGLEDETKTLVEATAKEARQRGEGIAVAVCEFARALLCNGLGQYDEALDAAKRAAEDTSEMVTQNLSLPELVEAAVRCGDLDLATEAYRRLSHKTMASGTDYALGVEARARALVSRDEEAESAYCQAIAYLERTSVRAELARSRLLYGEWLRRASRRVDARGELTSAYEAFSSMGMTAFAERARRELLATGETLHRRVEQPSHALTPQEVQVATLARNGMSNPEIGARLFISPRTVQYHLHKVFTKLAITSRTQLHLVLPGETPVRSALVQP